MSRYDAHIRLVTQAFPVAKRERDAYRQRYEQALEATAITKSLSEHIYLKMGNNKCLISPIHRLELYPRPLIFFRFLQSKKKIEHVIFGISHEGEDLFHANVEPETIDKTPHNRSQRLLDFFVPQSVHLPRLAYLVSVRRMCSTGLFPITQREHEQWELSLAVIRAPREGFDETFNRIISGR